MREAREYDDIPGTYVFDGAHSRVGYSLNMFCMSLNEEANRDEFRADELVCFRVAWIAVKSVAPTRPRTGRKSFFLQGNPF